MNQFKNLIASSGHSEKLTIGVEIEFLIVVDDSKLKSQIYSPLSDVHKAIHKACPNVRLNPFNHKAFEHFNALFAIDALLMPGSDPEADIINAKLVERGYENWTVHFDSTINFAGTEDESNLDMQPVELVSRTFDVEKDNWKGEISRVLTALHTKFNSRSRHNAYRMVANQTCGLHVHIGRGKSNHSFHTVKNLIQLGVAFERIIDQFHETQRIHTGNVAEGSSFCRPPSYFRLHAGPRHCEMPEDTMSWCQAIAYCTDKSDFARLVDHTKSSAYNLGESLKPAEESKKTIEFRQSAGTLDVPLICARIEFAIAMVKFANESNTSRVWKLVSEKGADPLFMSKSKFLSEIGASPALIKFFKQYLAPGAAAKRLNTMLSEETGTGLLPDLVRKVEQSRCARSDHSAVMKKVQAKLAAGVYALGGY